MSRYFKKLNENGELVMLLTYDFEPNITDPLMIEITATEYEAIGAECREKAELVNHLYRGKITIDDVPEDWQEKIQGSVDRVIAERGEYTPSPTALKAKAYDIITGAE